ncbi:MAG TPA: DUF6491 family protein [Steroidobacteraceae bacterium]|jgi:hypothetical protein|nr:DUF6491 family protein [Steroidobacteraceae bacterium]
MKKLYLVYGSIAFVLAACASLKNKDELNYQDYAGAPISSFWMPQLDGWTAVDDKLLVVRTQLNKEYLLKLAGFCPNLRFATAVGVTSSAGTVDRFEKVVVEKDTCMITEIRPIDSARMKADRKALKAKRPAEKKS